MSVLGLSFPYPAKRDGQYSLVHFVVGFQADRHPPAFDLVQLLVGDRQVHLVDLRYPHDEMRRSRVRFVLDDDRGV